MATGTVKWFNPTKGYGFIEPTGAGKGFRASLRVFDGDLYNEFSTTNILLGPRNLCSHVILVERRNFDVHAFCHSRSPLMSHHEQYYAHLKPGVVRCAS